MIDSKIDKIVNGFRGLERNIRGIEISETTLKLKEQTTAAQTQLYKVNGEISYGLKNLSQNINDVVPQLKLESVPANISEIVGIAKIDKSAFTSLSKEIPSSLAADLEAITGKSLNAAKNKTKSIALVLPHPQAIAKTLGKITNESSEAIKSLVKSNIDLADFDLDVIDNVVGEVQGSFKGQLKSLDKLQTAITDGQSALNRKLNFGFGSLMENSIENTFAPAGGVINSISKIGDVKTKISTADFQKVVSDLTVNNNMSAAVTTMKKYSDASETVIRDTLTKIDNRASIQLKPISEVNISIPVLETDKFVNTWREASTDVQEKGVFSTVSNIVSFENEIANLQREVTEVIITAAAAKGGKDIYTSIQEWHAEFIKQYNIGYNAHIYISRYGVSNRGKPLETELKQVGDDTHYKRSIKIHIEANEFPNDSQMKELKKLLKAIYKIKPGIQVFGNGQIKGNQQPYFDVPKYIKNTFGKSNIQGYNPGKSESLTREQLVQFNTPTPEAG